VRGDYVISDVTLNRFFAFHFVIPFVIAALVFLHIVALHRVGSTNPDGIEIKAKERRKRHSARRHPVPSVLHRQGHDGAGGLPGHLLGGALLCTGLWRAVPGGA
jgi:hypothetical protein